MPLEPKQPSFGQSIQIRLAGGGFDRADEGEH
jgi:hypothetical protein